METIDIIPTATILDESHDHHSIPTAETADIDSILDVGIYRRYDKMYCVIADPTLLCVDGVSSRNARCF